MSIYSCRRITVRVEPSNYKNAEVCRSLRNESCRFHYDGFDCVVLFEREDVVVLLRPHLVVVPILFHIFGVFAEKLLHNYLVEGVFAFPARQEHLALKASAFVRLHRVCATCNPFGLKENFPIFGRLPCHELDTTDKRFTVIVEDDGIGIIERCTNHLSLPRMYLLALLL